MNLLRITGRGRAEALTRSTSGRGGELKSWWKQTSSTMKNMIDRKGPGPDSVFCLFLYSFPVHSFPLLLPSPSSCSVLPSFITYFHPLLLLLSFLSSCSLLLSAFSFSVTPFSFQFLSNFLESHLHRETRSPTDWAGLKLRGQFLQSFKLLSVKPQKASHWIQLKS